MTRAKHTPDGVNHVHEFAPHPNPEWSTSHACTVCGFAIPNNLLSAARAAGAAIAEAKGEG